MENKRLALAAAFGVLLGVPASAPTFGELVEWRAPEDARARPGFRAGYLAGLASTDASLNDGVRACVPESEDRATIRALIQAFARGHRESLPDPGLAGLGQALKDRYPCA